MNINQMSQLDRIEAYSRLAAKSVLGLEEAALVLGISTSTLYKMTTGKKIPYYRPNGKLIYFSKKELEDWMMQNRVSSDAEVQAEAANLNLRRN